MYSLLKYLSDWNNRLRSLFLSLYRLEPIVLLVIVGVFWLGDANRVWSLLLLVPLIAVRLAAHRRLVTSTPLNLIFVAFLLLALLNIITAPYTRGTFLLVFEPLGWQAVVPWAWIMLGRPLMGIAIYFVFVEHARHFGMRDLIICTVGLGLIVASLALFATQWNSKSDQLGFIIDRLPQFRDVWLAPGGFNANEIAGGLAWLTPLCAALALYRGHGRWTQAGAAVVFALLLFVLFLGQSRLAIGGVVVGLAVVIVLLIPRGRRMALALAGLALFVAAEAALVTNVFASLSQAVEMQNRDENSSAGRLEMYISVIDILQDHPLTGVGMNMYRDNQVRARYPVPSYEDSGRILPHAHNEFLQIGTDLGYPGMSWFVVLHGMAALMAWRCVRQPDQASRVLAVAVVAALLAHGIYGTGDAVTLWDRFIFVFWWVLGLLGAQYTLMRLRAEPSVSNANDSLL